MGNYTDESTSPSLLLTSTIADELKIATRNKGLVYAIAPFRDAAIWVPDMRGTVPSGLITIPENGAVQLIIMNFRGGKSIQQPEISTTVSRIWYGHLHFLLPTIHFCQMAQRAISNTSWMVNGQISTAA